MKPLCYIDLNDIKRGADGRLYLKDSFAARVYSLPLPNQLEHDDVSLYTKYQVSPLLEAAGAALNFLKMHHWNDNAPGRGSWDLDAAGEVYEALLSARGND